MKKSAYFLILIFSLIMAACAQDERIENSLAVTTYEPKRPTVNIEKGYRIARGATRIEDLNVYYDPATKSMQLKGKIEYLSVKDNSLETMIVDLTGHLDSGGFITLKPPTAALDSKAVLAAKATCLSEEGTCRSSFVDIYIHVDGVVYHHQIESEHDLDEKVEAEEEQHLDDLHDGDEEEEDLVEGELGPYVGSIYDDIQNILNIMPELGAEGGAAVVKEVEPTPTPTPTPTPKSSPTPKTTPAPKTMPAPAVKPTPPLSPKATPAPAVKATPTPAPTPKPTPTPRPTATPAPAVKATPTPAPTPKPTPTPSPKATPAPAVKATPTPAPTPKPTPTEEVRSGLESSPRPQPRPKGLGKGNSATPVVNVKPPASVSQAVGAVGSGRLENAANLLEMLRITPSLGYKVLRPERQTHFGTNEIAYLIHRLSKSAQSVVPGYITALGDLSSQRGGTLRGHKSHTNGLDADIAYLFQTQSLRSAFTSAIAENKSHGSWMADEQWKIFKNAAETQLVDRIFIHRVLKSEICRIAIRNGEVDKNTKAGAAFEALRRMVPDTQHHNHFHLRVKCSSAQVRCRQMADPVATTGCF